MKPGKTLYVGTMVLPLARFRDSWGRPLNVDNCRADAFYPVYESREDYRADWPEGPEPMEVAVSEETFPAPRGAA